MLMTIEPSIEIERMMCFAKHDGRAHWKGLRGMLRPPCEPDEYCKGDAAQRRSKLGKRPDKHLHRPRMKT